MENACHLSIIIDFSPSQWLQSSLEGQKQTPFNLASFLPLLFVFLNAHLASQHENTLTVFGAFPGKSSILFSSNEAHDQAEPDSGTFQPFKTMNGVLVQRLSEALESIPEDSNDAPIALVGALTKALCYINRLIHPSTSTPTVSITQPNAITPRILIISVSPDLSASYIPIMNSIFCAQKLKVVLDVCKIYGPDTVFLQQAAHLTGGSYINVQQREALLQYLMTCFLSPPPLRRLMAVPTEDKVDFRAACFCHKTIVDIGFICSVCLSIFCKPTPVCSTCRTKFPMKTLQRLKEASKPALPTNIPDPVPVADTPPVTPAPGKSKGIPGLGLRHPMIPGLPHGMGMPGMPPGMHHGMIPGMPPGMGGMPMHPGMSMANGAGMHPGMMGPGGMMGRPPMPPSAKKGQPGMRPKGNQTPGGSSPMDWSRNTTPYPTPPQPSR
ncbi:Tfb4-domain-containing protein [Serendipita vermifera]|nr:Tfb4-domain-containing protein [Serendipita vermifera]